MGCAASRLDDDEAVQLCKDRKNFIKQAVEHRRQFASGHLAYIQSLRGVSSALRDYVEGDEPREFLLDSYTTPPFTPVKNSSPGFITISPDTVKVKQIKSTPHSTFKVNYLRSGGAPSVHFEERPQSPETVRVDAYSPMHQYGMDGFFSMQSPPMSRSIFHYSPNNRPNLPPPSPQTSQWDLFWNPFSSLDYYGYPTRDSLDQSVLDDDINGLRQVREEEGIPDLEEETEIEEVDNHRLNRREKRGNDEVVVEDDDDDDDDEEEDCDCNDDDCDCDDEEYVTDSGSETEREVEPRQSQGSRSMELSKLQKSAQVTKQETAIGEREAKEEKPGFTVYVNRRPTSMSEVIKDLETQFSIVCDAASEVSTMLEASKAQYSSPSNELTGMKLLNPVALLRSASSLSTSSRFLITPSSSSRHEGDDSSSDFSEDACMISGSHQTTLDKLYAWEKKLYMEVKAGERVRIAYEKKCAQLRDHDVRGDDPSSADKTRAAIRHLHTQIKISIHSVEAVSKRIETLRDEELQPQLSELVHGLARMWKVMAECHQTQKRTLDEAKILLAGMPSKLSGTKQYTSMSPSEPHRLARAAFNLENELRNWRSCFELWVTSQRSYIHALTGWLLRCVGSDPDPSKFPFSPRRSVGAPPIFGICIQWSRFLDTISEVPVLDGLDFFAAGMGSLYAQQLRESPGRAPMGSKRFGDSIGRTPIGSKRFDHSFSRTPIGSKRHGSGMEMVEAGKLEEVTMSAEKTAEIGIRVLCAGMSVAVSSLTQFAIGSAEGYSGLVLQWEHAKCPQNTGRTAS